MDLHTSVPRTTAEEVPSSGRRLDAGADSTVMYFAVLKSIGHDELTRQYSLVGKEVQGKILLSNEFSDIFQDAKVRAGVEPELILRDSPGMGHFNTDKAEKAVALCEAVLQRVEELNRGTARRLRKRVVAGVDVLRSPADAEPVDQVHQAKCFMDGLDALIESGSGGQLWLSNEVYRALPEESRRLYQRNEKARRRPAKGTNEAWMLQVTEASRSSALDGAIMDVDMARSMRIEKYIGGILNDAKQASFILKEQISKILRSGFALAGALSYEECHEVDTGDGAIFLFPSIAEAHAAAVGILTAADEYNRPAREDKNEHGLRCFRIGISHGHAGEDGSSEPSGNKFAEAKRVEEWGPTGEIRITEEAYARLPAKLQQLYGGVEQIPGKSGEAGIFARRCTVTERALWLEKDKATGVEYPPVSPRECEKPVVEKPKSIERCFIITPLRDEKRTKDVYEKLIVPACEGAGYEARRATHISGPPNQAIAENLGEAPMVVAYLGRLDPSTGWNQNVILEIGYRLATRLPLVIIGDANADGSVTDYQATLPFQLVHHKVITVTSDPRQSLPEIIREIIDSRLRKPRSQWDTPFPIVECKYTNYADVVITEANDAARALFGEETVRENAPAQRLTDSINARTDPVAGAARREEMYSVLERLETWHRNRLAGAVKRVVPQPRIPIVFTDTPPNPRTGNPEGYLPVVVRYTLEGNYIHVRMLYLKVSATMRMDPTLGYYVCDL